MPQVMQLTAKLRNHITPGSRGLRNATLLARSHEYPDKSPVHVDRPIPFMRQ